MRRSFKKSFERALIARERYLGRKLTDLEYERLYSALRKQCGLVSVSNDSKDVVIANLTSMVRDLQRGLQALNIKMNRIEFNQEETVKCKNPILGGYGRHTISAPGDGDNSPSIDITQSTFMFCCVDCQDERDLYAEIHDLDELSCDAHHKLVSAGTRVDAGAICDDALQMVISDRYALPVYGGNLFKLGETYGEQFSRLRCELLAMGFKDDQLARKPILYKSIYNEENFLKLYRSRDHRLPCEYTYDMFTSHSMIDVFKKVRLDLNDKAFALICNRINEALKEHSCEAAQKSGLWEIRCGNLISTVNNTDVWVGGFDSAYLCLSASQCIHNILNKYSWLFHQFGISRSS